MFWTFTWQGWIEDLHSFFCVLEADLGIIVFLYFYSIKTQPEITIQTVVEPE